MLIPDPGKNLPVHHGARPRQEGKQRFIGQPDSVASAWPRSSWLHLSRQKKLRPLSFRPSDGATLSFAVVAPKLCSQCWFSLRHYVVAHLRGAAMGHLPSCIYSCPMLHIPMPIKSLQSNLNMHKVPTVAVSAPDCEGRMPRFLVQNSYKYCTSSNTCKISLFL